jgi:hypothetical protein
MRYLIILCLLVGCRVRNTSDKTHKIKEVRDESVGVCESRCELLGAEVVNKGFLDCYCLTAAGTLVWFDNYVFGQTTQAVPVVIEYRTPVGESLPWSSTGSAHYPKTGGAK